MMSENSGSLKRNIKRFFGVLLLVSVLLAIVALWTWRTVRTDHAYTIKRIQEFARNQHNAKLEIGGYQLKWIKPFPSLDIVIEDIRLASVFDSTAPVLRTNRLQTQINLLDWYNGLLKAQPVTLDSAWVHIRRNTQGHSNLRFAATREQKKVEPWTLDFLDLPEVTFHFLDFHNENQERRKWQRAQMLKGQITTKTNEEGTAIVNLNSDVHFDGLLFNPEDGGYLMNRTGAWNLNFGMAENGLSIKLHPSSLRVEDTEFQLGGAFYRADTNRLKLSISNDGVLMTTILPLLSEKVQQKLGEIKIDQPVVASFSMDELLHPSKRGAMSIDFAARDAALRFRNLFVNHTDFIGYYSNDCDGDGLGDIENSCIVFEKVLGELYGVIPTNARGRLDNLGDAQLTAVGTMDIDLSRLNERLSASNKFTFKEGLAQLKMNYQGPFADIVKDPFNEEKVKMEGAVTFENVVLDLPSQNEPFPALSGQMRFDDRATTLDALDLQWIGANIRLSGQLNNLPEFLFFEKQALQSDLRLYFDHLDLNKANLRANATKAEDFDYQKIRTIARKVATNINGQLELNIDRLTYDTFTLNNLHTQFSLFSPLLFEENSDSAMIKMEKLSGDFMGHTPFEIGIGFSQETDTKLLVDFDFPDAQVFANILMPQGNSIKKGRISMTFNGKIPLKSMNRLDRIRSTMDYSGRVNLRKVDMELASFTWPIETLSGDFIFDEEVATFMGFQFDYEGAPFELNGTIRDYTNLGKESANVDLALLGRSINLRNDQLENRVDPTPEKAFVPADLFRGLDSIYQLATGRLSLQVDTIYTLEQTISPISAIIELAADPLSSGRSANNNYQLKLDQMRIGLGGRNLITGNAMVKNPKQPVIEAKLKSVLDFTKLADFLSSEYIELQDGFFRMELDYKSPLYDTINAANYLLKAELQGDVEVEGGKFFYNYRDFQVDQMYSHIRFDNQDLEIRDIDLRLNGNRLFADGTSADFFPFFILPDRKAQFDLSVASPAFDFGTFTAPHGLGKDTVNLDTTSMLQKTGSFIDRLLSNSTLDMDADFKRIEYETFQASDLHGNISLHPDTVKLNEVNMNLAEGAFRVDGSITNIIFHEPEIKLDAKFEESNIRQLMEQFQNFGQSALDSTNIKGFATVDVQFRSDANSNYALLSNTMFGDFQLKLLGGQLINLPGVKKVSGFLSKKRQLDHILIDTLETKTHIRGSDLYIDQFNLQSSSFDFDVEGIYSLGDTNNTKILFGVPLSNLFRRHISSDEREQDKQRRKGLKVFIEARPHKRKDKMIFRWKIPFGRKKYRLPEESTNPSSH